MKNIILAYLLLFTTAFFAQENSIYEYEVQSIEGETLKLSDFKGKKVMIVNTASKCGFTPQYEELQELYERYKDDNFVILGFPSNDFMKQEPGSNEEIANFCQKNYGVSFPMMSKVKVKGDDKISLYEYLTEKKLNGYQDTEVRWNFQKYLIGKNGKLEKVYYSKTKPLDEAIINWIEQ